MTDLQPVIAGNREAVEAFVAAARAIPASQWELPRAPDKWSPRQVTEHVALAYELSRAVLHHSFPGRAAPRLLRPLIRTLFLKPVLRSGRFGKGGKSPGPFRPTAAPEAVGPLTGRLQGAAAGFEADLLARANAGETTVDHPFFGELSLPDFLRLQMIHARHHRRQLPGAAG